MKIKQGVFHQNIFALFSLWPPKFSHDCTRASNIVLTVTHIYVGIFLGRKSAIFIQYFKPLYYIDKNSDIFQTKHSHDFLYLLLYINSLYLQTTECMILQKYKKMIILQKKNTVYTKLWRMNH